MNIIPSYITSELTEPYEQQIKQLTTQLLDKAYEHTGSRYAMYKGRVFEDNRTSNILHYKLVLLPEVLYDEADALIAYQADVESKRSDLLNYLYQLRVSSLGRKRILNAYLPHLPASCHHIFTDETFKVSHEIPTWLEEMVAESLLLRTLYEIS